MRLSVGFGITFTATFPKLAKLYWLKWDAFKCTQTMGAFMIL